MTAFAGWRLPVFYNPGGVVAEHNAARESAALFDVSHMAQVAVRGPGAAEALAKILPADIAALRPGESKYAAMLNDNGGVVDDLIVSNDGEMFFIVANASRREVDLAHLRANLPADCQPEEIADRALVAAQGPKAADIVSEIFPAASALKFMHSARADFEGEACRVSRTGYTGEDGFEISVPASRAEALCRRLTESGEMQPAGLGARDTLRTEAGLCLYGNELREDVSPIEAGLAWTIPKSRRDNGGFIGAAAVSELLKNGPPRKLVGLRPQERVIIRGGAKLFGGDGDNDDNIGEVTSGVFSPTLQAPIAMGFVKTEFAATGGTVFAEVRGKRVPCNIVDIPFVPRNYKR